MKRLTFPLAFLLFAGFSTAADDLETAFENLKKDESTKDPAQVKKRAVETIALARQAANAPAPANDEEKDGWKQRTEYAKTVELHCEYALYAAAVQGPPAATIDLITTLETQNPKSRYLDDAYGLYLLALNKTGAASRIPDLAEKALANFPENEDLLLVVAEHTRSGNQTDRALAYANRLVIVMTRHPRPDGTPAADWERKRSALLGRGYWIAGVIHGERNRYVDADKSLRAALPLIRENDAMMGPALFYLGVANYQLGKMTLNKARVLEGAAFSDKAAVINGPFAQLAYKNSLIMKRDASNMR